MSRDSLSRFVGEFLVIVLGVLVALGVDDWRQGRIDRDRERNLLARMEVELGNDATDAGRAELSARQRAWVLDALLAAGGDVAASARLSPQRRDSVINPARGYGTPAFQPEASPLAVFRSFPEFDLSDDAHQEMLSTGSFQTISDPDLRSSIMRYYRIAADQGDNSRRAGAYQDQLDVALSRANVSFGDDLSLAELTTRLTGETWFAVEARRAINLINQQLRYYAVIQREGRDLEERLTETAR